MVSKTVILGLLSKNDSMVDKALNAVIQEHKNAILEKIYESNEESDFSVCNYAVISKSDFEYIEKVFGEYDKFLKHQKGKRHIQIDIKELQKLKDIGLSNRQIADKFNVSEGTIRNRLIGKKSKMISFKNNNNLRK